MSARRGAAGLGAATVLALTAGCGMLGIGGEEKASDEERLVEMLNENERIRSELIAAELRIVQNCLEAAGHTVHEPWEMQVWEPEEQEALNTWYPHQDFLIDAEEAAQYGFGQWANSPDAMDSSEAEDYYAAQEEKWEEEESDSNWEEPDTTEWDALAPEEQYAWYVAFQGEEYVLEMHGSEQEYVSAMSGEGEEFTEEELTEEELAALEEEAAAEDEGEIEVESEAYEEPKPGGCKLEMIEALYGEPRLVEYEWDGGTDKYWEYRPENPLESEDDSEAMWADVEAEYAAAMGDKQAEFLDCISGKGHEGWEFTEYNTLPLWEFFTELYYQNDPEQGEMYGSGDSDVEVPPLPENAGSTYEEWKAYEIQLAVDFAACGDEIGYADASKKAYDDSYIKLYESVEEEMYAWQKQMNDAITKAQEILDA